MKLPVDIINPSKVTEFEYKTSGTHHTPWFNAGQSEVKKLALKLRVEVQDSSISETVQVHYATNYVEAYSGDTGGSLGTIEADGITTYEFPNSTTPSGTEFRAIKFKLTLSRANSVAADKKKTPDVVSMTLEWRKKLEAKWGHQARINLNKTYKGNSPKDLRSSLVSATESTSLVEFTFRDASGTTRNYYVDVVSASGVEGSGYDERGMSTVNLVEP